LRCTAAGDELDRGISVGRRAREAGGPPPTTVALTDRQDPARSGMIEIARTFVLLAGMWVIHGIQLDSEKATMNTPSTA
jgi:hypothetical protein